MQSLSSQQAYWDRQADSANFTLELNHGRLTELVPTSARILDLGCGYGRTLRSLHALGFTELAGLDPSGKMIDRARQNLPEAEARLIQGYPTDLEDNAYDAVLVVAVLTCIPRDNDQRSLIVEILRITRPGGLIFVADFLLSNDQRSRDRYASATEVHTGYGIFEVADGAIHRHHSREWIDNLLSPFERTDYEELPVVTRHGNPARGFRFVGRKRR